jgi:hypothetical protein
VKDIDVSVPADWYAISADAATRRETALRDIAARAETQPELATYADHIADVLVAFGADAEEHGALACGALWELTPQGPVVASVMVLLVESLGQGSADAELNAIAETLASQRATDIGPREVSMMALPVGPAAQVRFLRAADEDGAPRVVFDDTQVWIPLSGPPDGPVTLVVTATTPSLDAGDRVAEAAWRIAQSVVVG